MLGLLRRQLTKATLSGVPVQKGEASPMPIARRRWGELPKPESSELHQLQSLLCHPSVCSWGLSTHPPSSPTPQGARRRPDSDPPAMTWRSFGLAKAGWALTTSLSAPGILAVLWEGGLQLLIWGGKQSREVRGRAVSITATPSPQAGRGLREHPTVRIINSRLNCEEWKGGSHR